MKKIIVAFISIAMFAACGGGGSKDEKKDDKKEAVAEKDLSANPDYQKGLELASRTDCFTCHKIDDALTGPPYRDIANKYGGMPDTIITHLAGKIIHGGNGVWGQAMMTPHPGITEGDAEAMVKYILLLKK